MEYSRPRRKDYFPTSWTARKPVPSEDGGWHRPDSSTVGTFGTNPFGPAVASPFPCVYGPVRPLVVRRFPYALYFREVGDELVMP